MKHHYVPRLVLKKFSSKICLFNVRTGEYLENRSNEKIFYQKDLYTQEIEDKLNKKIESQFGNLFNNKIYKEENQIVLNRDELRLIKKFLLISVIRSMGNEKFMQQEKHYYDRLSEFNEKNNITNYSINPPFIEKEIVGETPYDYWMRTLNVILDSDGSPQSILEHPEKTYPAHRWATVINNGYIAFWDSEYDHHEFIITDIGMTSENEKGWNGINVHNVKKTNYLLYLFEITKDKVAQKEIFKLMNLHHCFTENFMMFPISAKRMIVEIDPFFKFRFLYSHLPNLPKLEDLTMIPNENLFKPNKNQYYYTQGYGKEIKYHPEDKYIYEIKKLSRKETKYCNELFLDRIDTWVGFSSLNKVVGSIFAYKKNNEVPYTPRVDYTELYKLINQRYGSSINLGNICGFRKKDTD